jgi:hypothetical protein
MVSVRNVHDLNFFFLVLCQTFGIVAGSVHLKVQQRYTGHPNQVFRIIVMVSTPHQPEWELQYYGRIQQNVASI